MRGVAAIRTEGEHLPDSTPHIDNENLVPPCPPGEIWNSCGTDCPLTCENPNVGFCNMMCVAGCFCPPGWYRNEATGECVETLDECELDEPDDCMSCDDAVAAAWPPNAPKSPSEAKNISE